MKKQSKNRGFNEEIESLSQNGSEWVFGSESVEFIYTIKDAKDRILNLPVGEVQKGEEDTMDCATRGPINILEMLFTHAVRTQQMSRGNIIWLYEKGYVDADERVVFSDAFNAIKSGTSQQGNSMKAPLDSIRKDGLIPKVMLPLQGWMTWGDYHDKRRITEDMEDLGRAFAKRFSINYEKVFAENIKDACVNEAIVTAGYAWPKPKNGVYGPSKNKANHVFATLKPEYYVFDNYIDTVDEDFIKRLAKDYTYFEYGYRVGVTAENPNVSDEWYSIRYLSNLVAKLTKALTTLFENKTPAPLPVVVEEKQEDTPEEKSIALADSIAKTIYLEAKKCLGTDPSPKDTAPDELACVDSVTNILQKVMKFPHLVSTITLKSTLDKDDRFERTLDIKPGYIILSPTASGNGRIRGHVGIVSDGGKIMSNTSRTGIWEENYTLDTWVERWRNYGGMPVFVYRPV